MKTFPRTDLDPTFASDISLRVQNPEVLDVMHTIAEDRVYPYSIMHSAITLAAGPSLQNEHLENAVTTGVSVYEAMAGAYSDINSYDSEAARALSVVGPMLFVEAIHSAEDFLDRLHTAKDHLEQDSPVLAEAVADASRRYTKEDLVAHKFAIGAAGLMRSMQIFIDKRLDVVDSISE